MYSQKKIIVFDICHTLFYSNTTFEFIEYYHNKQPKSFRKWIHHILLSKRLPFIWILIALGKISDRDLPKFVAASSLKRMPIDAIEKLAGVFYSDILQNKKIAESFDLLDNFNKDDVVLVSATIEPVAKAIASALDVNYLATELETINGRFTGRIRKELSGQKLNELYERDFLNISWAISDNRSDLSLLERSEKSIAICHTNADVEFWSRYKQIKPLLVTTSLTPTSPILIHS